MKKLFTIIILALFPLSGIYAQSVVYETLTVKSEILKMERKYAIYLPSGYDRSDQSYPVLYLLHGAGDDHTGWVQFGQVQHIADKTIAEGKAGPMIIVMPDANSGRRGYFNDAEGDFNYEDFFFKELIPHIEKTYRVRSERRYRAVSGLSMGGGGTIFYALHQPGMFAAAAPLSASTGNWNVEQLLKSFLESKDAQDFLKNHSIEELKAYVKRQSIEDIIKDASKEELDKIKQIRWYISCGDDDFLYEGNSMMHILFRKNEIAHEFRVKDGGHTWTYWRMELPLVMEFVAKSFMQH
jgi:enterochelin esterase-like enzyme